MANENSFQILKQGTLSWNSWRIENPSIGKTERIDLSSADFAGASLIGVNLSGVDLTYANFKGANLSNATFADADLFHADFSYAILTGAEFSGGSLNQAVFAYASLERTKFSNTILRDNNFNHTDLRRTIFADVAFISVTMYQCNLSELKLNNKKLYDVNFTEANLFRCQLSKTDLRYSNFSNSYLAEADLTGANLNYTIFIKTNIEQAKLSECSIYGLSVWDVLGSPSDQSNLRITEENEAEITVDDLQVGQFVYLLMNNSKIRNVIDTITSKAVLILGRFTAERKIILDAIATELKKNNLLPIIFDFEKPSARDFTETVKTLASISLFVIADITNPKSSPLELQAIVPDYQIPFVLIIQEGEQPFSMAGDLIKFDWVLSSVITYRSKDDLLIGFKEAILDRAWQKYKELKSKKIAKIQTISIEDFIKNNS